MEELEVLISMMEGARMPEYATLASSGLIESEISTSSAAYAIAVAISAR